MILRNALTDAEPAEIESDIESNRGIEFSDIIFEGEADQLQLGTLSGRQFAGKVCFRNSVFRVPVDLSNIECRSSVSFENCLFLHGFQLRNARISGSLSIKRCAIASRRPVDLSGLRVGGALHMQRLSSRAAIDLTQASIGGEMLMSGLLIQGTFEDSATDAVDTSGGLSGSFAICMRGTKCNNRIRIENNARRRSRFRGGIDLRGIESVGLTVCTSDIRAMAATAIDLSGSTIHGDVRFAANVQVEGTLNLRAEIAGDVEFCQANIHALGQTAVDLSRAHVAGHILIDQRSRIEGSVLLGARIDGNVTVGNATIVATGMTAVSLESAETRGNVLFHEGARIEGAVDLRGRFNGWLAFDNATILANGQTAINLEAASVNGAVLFAAGTRIEGCVNIRAQVAGDVSVSNCIFRAGLLNAFDLTHARVTGRLILREGTRIEGHVRLAQAVIGGVSANAVHPDHRVTRPEIGGRRSVTVTGLLDARYARIKGTFAACHADLIGGVDLHHAIVSGELALHGTAIGATLDYREKAAIETALKGGQRDVVDKSKPWKQQIALILETPVQLEWPRPRRSENECELPMAYIERLARSVWIKADLEQRFTMPEIDLANKPALALNVQFAEIRGNLRLSGATIHGSIIADHARINGALSTTETLIGGHFSLAHATIRGDVFSGESTESGGSNPQMKGDLDLANTRLGDVHINLDRTARTTAPAHIRFDHARINLLELSGRLDETEPRISAHEISATELELDGLDFPPIEKDLRRDWLRKMLWLFMMSLAMLSLLSVRTEPGAWIVLIAIAAYGVTSAAGWRDAPWRKQQREMTDRAIRFLDSVQFSPSLYRAMANRALAIGDIPTADEIYLCRKRRELREMRPAPGQARGKRPVYQRAMRWWRWCALDFLTGYGLRPGRLIHIFALCWLINWAICLSPRSVESVDYGHASQAAYVQEWGAQYALVASTHMQLPMIDQSGVGWKLSSATIPWTAGITYENFGLFMRVANSVILLGILFCVASALNRHRSTGKSA